MMLPITDYSTGGATVLVAALALTVVLALVG